MPNEINPFDYNIDSFDSGFLGPITDSNFRTFLFTHNLQYVNPVIQNTLGGNLFVDRGSEYDVSQSTFNVRDVPNLQTVANTPSVHNNLTNPRQTNVGRNLTTINPEVATEIGSNSLTSEGLGNDAATLINNNPTVVDVPNLQNVASNPSVYNDLTNPRQDNLSKKVQNIDASIQNNLGVTTPTNAGQGNDVTTLFNPNTSNVDVPNLRTVANTPSVYNNLTNPREVNLSKKLQNLDPEIQNILGQNTALQAGLGVDAPDNFNANVSNVNLPGVSVVANTPSNLNNQTNPTEVNLVKNPTKAELSAWYPNYSYWINSENDTYKQPFNVPNTLKLGFVGDVEQWIYSNGMATSTSIIRDLGYYKQNNKYGPSTLTAYEASDFAPPPQTEKSVLQKAYDVTIGPLIDAIKSGSFSQEVGPVTPNQRIINQETGLIGYSTEVKSDFKDQLLNRTLGVGIVPFGLTEGIPVLGSTSIIGSGINFKPDGKDISNLDRIARKRRLIEIFNRVKSNAIDDTIGRFGFLERPFATLADTKNIFEKNYIITSRKGAVGSILQSASSLIGLNPVNSPIPSGAFTPSNDIGNSFSKQTGYDISEDLLDRTGNATRSLLFDALKINKYGPKTEEKYRLQYKSEEQENYLTFNPREKNLKEKLDSLQKQGKVSPPGEFIQVTEGGPSNPADQDNSTPIYGGFFGKFETPINDNSFSDERNFNETDSARPYAQILDSAIRPSNTSYRGTPTELNVTNRITDEKYQWVKQDEGKNPNPFAKGLMRYTKALANKATRKQGAGYIAYFDSQEAFNGNPDYKQSINRHGHSTGIENINNPPTKPSKGNTSKTARINTNNGEIETNSGEYYCRSWSSRRKYHNYENLIRNDVNWRYDKKNDKTMTMNWDANNGGVSNGMPKIAWTQNDSDNYGESYKKQIIGALKDTQILKGQMIPYMFSIENLAWVGSPHVLELAPCEIGPNGGRIMWFPPYNLEISDSSSVSWDPTSFIGRGENIYTYNNTERTGTLDFTLIVDHPSVLNDLKKNFKENIYKGGDEIYHSFFAGCDAETIKKYFDGYIPTILKDVVEEFEIPPPELNITPPEQPPINDIKIFFENAYNGKKESVGIKIDLEEYEIKFPFTADYSKYNKTNGLTEKGNYGKEYVDTKLWETNGLVYPCGPAGTNSYKYLNTDVKSNLEKLAFFLAGTEAGKNYKIKFFGSASAAAPSAQGQLTSAGVNNQISENRGQNFKEYFKEILLGVEDYLLTYYPDKVPVRLSVDNDLTYPLEKDLLNNTDRWDDKVGFEPKNYDELSTKLSVEKDVLRRGDDFIGSNPCCPGCVLPKPWDVDETTGEIPYGNKNSSVSKVSRYAKLSVELNTKLQENLLIEANNKLKPKKETRIVGQEEVKDEIIAQEIAKRFVTECDAFEHIKYKINPFIYESLREKIRYFHPAFHSQTPEGFNGRLTFLKQCTRQGPQIIDKNSPANMVFGRPPVLVLRIGDFYHTKIIPDNVNITYEPLQWDLNPEGIGVQPMLAKVSISFKYIGGSSLGGPIRQLQNAVSFNFFANTSVYNPAQIKTQQLLEKKYNFIYGAFASPEEERKLTRELESLNNVSEEIKKEEQNVVTVQDTQPAQTTTEEKQKVEEEATKNNTGEVKPPAPPVKGNKLKDVLRDVNKDYTTAAGTINPSGTYIIKNGMITSAKEPTSNGIYLDEKVIKDTGLKKFINKYYIKFNDKGDFVINKETFIRENNGTERVTSGSYKGLLFGKYYNFGSPTNEYGEATLQFTDGKIIKGNAWYPNITQELSALIKKL